MFVNAMLVVVNTVATQPAMPDAPVDFPHPMISEVLFSVPKGGRLEDGSLLGDADKSGVRDSTGDEFVELYNPHDKPIDLRGYRLVDAGKPNDNQLRFQFPKLVLQPGECVVVFNARADRIPGPVGTARRAAREPNPEFAGAWVLTLDNRSSNVGLANDDDFVVLLDPRGRPLQAVVWGEPDIEPPKIEALEYVGGTSRGSVQWFWHEGPFLVHDEIDGLPYSPGRFGPPEEDDWTSWTTADPDEPGGESAEVDEGR